MNMNLRRRAELEMRWHSIIAADQPKERFPKLTMNWISITSQQSRLSN